MRNVIFFILYINTIYSSEQQVTPLQQLSSHEQLEALCSALEITLPNPKRYANLPASPQVDMDETAAHLETNIFRSMEQRHTTSLITHAIQPQTKPTSKAQAKRRYSPTKKYNLRPRNKKPNR